MIIKIKKTGFLGPVKSENRVQIDDLMFNEDLLMPENEHVKVFFRGQDASGILHLGREEVKRLVKTLERNIEMIDGSKIITIPKNTASLKKVGKAKKKVKRKAQLKRKAKKVAKKSSKTKKKRKSWRR